MGDAFAPADSCAKAGIARAAAKAAATNALDCTKLRRESASFIDRRLLRRSKLTSAFDEAGWVKANGRHLQIDFKTNNLCLHLHAHFFIWCKNNPFCQSCGSQPFSYSRPHIVIASASFFTCPLLASSCNSRFTSQATFESCSIVTATLPIETGALSFSPLRTPAMKLAKCASVIESRPVKSLDEVTLPTLNSLVLFPFTS